MKLFVLCSLLAVTLAATSHQQWLRNAEPFRSGREYVYKYKSQIASGIGSLDQHSVHLLFSDAHIHFESDRVATLRLKNIRVGVRNEMIAEPHRIQPSQLFEEKTIDSELIEKLELALRFDYVEGIVENIHFNEKDTTWSKNVKRAVLNLLQVNLSRRNSQDNDQSSSYSDDEKSSLKMYSVEEATIEGICKTSYTLNPTESREEKDFFNVTKSIDFSQCKQVPFVRYGPRIDLPVWQPRGEEQRQQIEVDKQQQLDRTSVWDIQLSGSQSRFGVARSEVTSQYVYRLMSAQAQIPMRTLAVSQVILEAVHQRSNEREVSVSQKDEPLVYSLDWDTAERRFYQLGDEEFSNKKTPFHDVHGKADMIEQRIRDVAKSSWDQTNGITSENALKVQEITELIRMCTVKELRQVREKLSDEDEGLFVDVLAIAGTRNTIHFLTTEIMKKDIPAAKAVQALRQLNGQFAVSPVQVEDVLKLCKHEVTRRSSPLRQSCWLTFGSMVNELCKESSMTRDQEAQEQCSTSHQNKYHKAMMDEYSDADTIYEKVLALKTIGNAALHKSIHDLEKIITERKDESPIVRQQAIDSLRRYRNQMPRKIQRILMPLLQNIRERPELRMTALSMIMYTSPDREILDQLTHLLFNERSQHFRSFVYSTLKVYSESPVESERDLAMHLQSVLRMVDIDEDELRASRMWRVPVYSQAEREGLLLNLATGYASGNIIPQQMSISMDTIWNQLLEQKNLELTLTQINIEQLFTKLWERFTSNSRSSTRGDRHSSTSTENGRDLLEKIFDTLKIQRGSLNKASLGMICLRIRDVDYFVLPLSEESISEMTRDMTSTGFMNMLREKQVFKFNSLASLHERVMKVPTSAGLPLRMSHYMPVVASIQGDLKMTIQDEIKAKINVKPMISTVHSQRMEMWSPIVNTGVETLHKVSLNTPINMDIKSLYNNENSEEKLRLTYNLPEDKVTLLDASALPLTFIRPFNYKTKVHSEATIKTIRNPLMDSRLVEFRSNSDSEDKKSCISVHGFYHTPSESTYRNWYSLATINEHHISVDFDAISGTPKSFDLILRAKLFQDVDRSSHRPSFRSFFESTKNRYEAVEDEEDREYSRDMDNFELESESTRRNNFQDYIKNTYRANKVYQHNVNAVLRSNGGRTQYKTEVDLKAVCDSKLTLCKLTTDVKCNLYKNKEWTMKSNVQILAPEYVNDIDELKDNKQNKLAITVECEFGFDKKETLKLQIEGERAVPQQWTRNRWHRIVATAFINKYDIKADYDMSPYYRRWISRVWELFKLANYFNMPIDKAIDGKEGEVTATIVIDPLTRKYVNMTIKTPREYVRINNVALPMSIKPFPLIRSQDKSFEIHSTSGLFRKVSDDYSRAECRVDGRKIRTFDSVVYKAPLGKCYSVIAKDCVDKTFAVLMKTLDKESQKKKVKIVNRQDIIELEQAYDRDFTVKVNGRRIESDETDKLSEYNIDYSDEMIRVSLPQGVVVKFNGKQATVKLSQYYQNSQCGLCGTMNDEDHDEFRKSDDTLTDDVKEFHRSFSMLKGDDECEEQEDSKLYSDDSLFDREMPRSRWEEEDEEDSRFEADEDVESYGHFDRKTSREDEDEDNTENRPILKTKIVEYNHKLCFSLKPAKVCPKGTSAERSETIKSQFTCLNRSKPETRRLLRQARTQDITSQLEGFKTSFVDTLTSAVVCV